MASSMAVPRVNTFTGGSKKFPNLPVIEHPMSKMNNRENLAILGSARINGVSGVVNTKDPPLLSARKSAPERILNWPPVAEFVAPYQYRQSAAERMGLIRKKSVHKRKKPVILPRLEERTGVVGCKVSTPSTDRFKLPPLEQVLEIIDEEDADYTQNPQKVRNKREDPLTARPCSSVEVNEKIKEKLTTGFYGLRHLFKANDPAGKGTVSRDALLRILYSLVGYITQDQYSKFLKGSPLEGKEYISFDDFVACFRENETVQKEWLSPLQRVEKDAAQSRLHPEEDLKRRDLMVSNPYLSAPFSDAIFKDKIKTIDDARKVFPAACFLSDGMIVPPQLREAYAQLGIYMKDVDFMTLWHRYDKEGLGAVRTNLFLKRVGVDRRPKTYTPRSKTMVDIKTRPKSEQADMAAQEKVKAEVDAKLPKDDDKNQETCKDQAEKEDSAEQEVSEKDKKEENKVKVVKKKKVQPKLENIIDCLHYRFEESYNAMLAAFDLFDYLSDGYISRVDFRRVLQEFGMNISVTDLDNFLARNGVRTIRGQINYKEFLNKFQSKSENSVTNRIVTSQQFQNDKVPSWPLPKSVLTSEELDVRLVDLLHGEFFKLIGYFKSCDKYSLGVITPHEFRSGIEKRLGYPMSEKQWEQLKADVGQDSDGLVPYNRFLQMFDAPPGAWNTKQEGGLDVYQVIPSSMVHSSAVERLKEKAKTFMQPQALPEFPPQDGSRTIMDVMKILEDLFRNKFHTFDKHFQDMDRRKTGRMSKWQFGALLRLCGVNLTTSELDRVWVRQNTDPDGMYSYKTLIKSFMQPKDLVEKPLEQERGDTRELIEAARCVQRERREKTMTSIQQISTTTSETQHDTKTGTTINKEQHTKTTTTVDKKETSTSTIVNELQRAATLQPQETNSTVNKSLRTRDLLNKIKNQVINNWEGLKSVFKFIDKNGSGTISISDMKEVFNTMKFSLSEDEKRELCQRFDLQRNGRFHYLEFMKCYSQRQPKNVSKSQSFVYSKHNHKLERKLMAEHKNLRRAFRRLDQDRKGYLGVGDFRKVLNGCKIEVSNEDFYHLLSEFDHEMRGRISYNDFLATFVDNY